VRAGFQQTMSAAVDEQVAKIVGDFGPTEGKKASRRPGRRRRSA